MNYADAEIDAPDLRPYQADAIDRLRGELARTRKPVVLQASTGAGKTVTAADIICKAQANNKRTLFVCDSLELVGQAVATFDRYGLDVGVMQGNHERTDESRLVQVCTAQTLERRIKKHALEFERYPVHLIIHDEAHVQHRTRETLAALYPNAATVGLTATPFAKGMGKFYGSVVSAISMGELIEQGYLSPYRAYAPFVPDMAGVKSHAGDYTADASAAVYDQEIIGDLVSTWKRLASDRPTLAFGCNVAHSKAIAQEFINAGVKAAHIDGYGGDVEKAERAEAIRKYKAGEIQLLSSVGILTKGFDAPLTSCLVIARPTKSLMLHWQIVGRALRTCANKNDALILDHAGNFVRHGFPDDPIDFDLDDGKKTESKSDSRKKDEKLPVPCPACHALKTVHKCPSCGFAPEKQNTIVNVDGELVELKKAQADKRKKERDNSPQTKQRWYSELLTIADQRGYQKGWVANKYRSKFEVWPRGLNEEKRPVSSDVDSFIRYQNIKYAKGKEKANV